MALNVNNAFYNYYFESKKKKIKYYEIFLLEKKKSQPIQFLQDNFTLFPISFPFFLKGLLELASRMSEIWPYTVLAMVCENTFLMAPSKNQIKFLLRLLSYSKNHAY